MEQAISHANLVVNRTARDTEALRGMGTTVVLAVAEGNTVTIAHAGDSRAYLIHGEELSQLTHDHTVVQMLMERGEITEEEALSHPQRHYITRAVGVDCEIRVEFSQAELGEGDAVLLCSDGLYNYADPTDFPRLVREALESGDASGFIDAANAGGGGDNITAVILVRRCKGEDRWISISASVWMDGTWWMNWWASAVWQMSTRPPMYPMDALWR